MTAAICAASAGVVALFASTMAAVCPECPKTEHERAPRPDGLEERARRCAARAIAAYTDAVSRLGG